MRKHLLARALACVMSVSLLSTTAFAAPVAFDQTQHMDSTTGVLLGHTNEGSEDLTYDYYLDSDVELDKTLVIKDGVDASINLNGHELSGNSESSVIKVTGEASLTLSDEKVPSTEDTDTEAEADGDDAQTDETGKITGGGGKAGGGIYVDDNANVTMNGGEISGNKVAENGGGVYIKDGGTFTMNGGEITENSTGHSGGGVFVNNGYDGWDHAQFNMNGGTISNNTASGPNANGGIGGAGGGIAAAGTSTADNAGEDAVVIQNGTITGNRAEIDGGGIYLTNSNASITGSAISDNTAAAIQGEGTVQSGGGIFVTGNKSDVTVTNSTISGNEASQGGGIYVQQGAEVTMNGGSVTGNKANAGGGGILVNKNSTFIAEEGTEIYNNSASAHSDDVRKIAGATLKLPSAASMNVIGPDGKPITGWFFDGSNRWGDESHKNAYTTQESHAVDENCQHGLSLKAAHDRYFDVTYTDGADGAVFADEKHEVENKNPVPFYKGGEEPVREGYTFIGWRVSDDTEIDLETATVTGTLILVAQWEEIIPDVPETPDTPDVPDTPDTPDEPDVPDVPDTPDFPEDPDVEDEPEAETVSIDDETVPLAGIVTLAQMLEEMRVHEQAEDVELPADFKFIDHEYAQAIYWALERQLVVDTEDEPLDPDAIVTVGLVRQVQENFVTYYKVLKGFTVDVEGEEDEIVMDLGERLSAFYEDLEAWSQN